jgi:signal peptidase II
MEQENVESHSEAQPLQWANFRLGMIVAIVALVIDQANKLWLIFSYDIAAKAPVSLTSFFDLVMVWNRGISYGLLQQDSDFGRWALIVFALGVSIGLSLWLLRLETRLAAVSVGLIVGGAIGNAIDRIAYGAVADFYSLQIFGFDWYVFNIADCWVVVGVVGLLYDSLFTHHKMVSNRSKM